MLAEPANRACHLEHMRQGASDRVPESSRGPAGGSPPGRPSSGPGRDRCRERGGHLPRPTWPTSDAALIQRPGAAPPTSTNHPRSSPAAYSRNTRIIRPLREARISGWRKPASSDPYAPPSRACRGRPATRPAKRSANSPTRCGPARAARSRCGKAAGRRRRTVRLGPVPVTALLMAHADVVTIPSMLLLPVM